MSHASTPATRSQVTVRVPAGDRDPEVIQSDMEITRERLAGTIDELLYRSHPKTILKRALDSAKAPFVDERGNPRTDKIATAAGMVVGALTVLVTIRKAVSRKTTG